MERLTQDPRLTLRALPIVGDEEVPDGVHLRWGFAPELGFPPAGFNLLVRPHQEGSVRTGEVGATAAEHAGLSPVGVHAGGVTVHSEDGRPLEVAERCGEVGLELGPRTWVVRFRDGFGARPRVVREVWLSGVHERGGVTARGWHGGRVAACASTCACADGGTGASGKLAATSEASGEDCTPFEVHLRADGIDTVTVSGCDGVLLLVTYVVVEDHDRERGWDMLTDPLCLPVGASPHYPCPPAVDPLDVVKSRLPEPEELPPRAPRWDDLVTRLTGPDFDELRGTLEEMLSQAGSVPAHLQERLLTSDDGDEAVRYRLQPLQHVLLASIDPYVARVLGLYHLDKRTSGTWDYMVQAAWDTGQGVVDLAWIAYGVAPGAQPPLLPPGGVVATAVAAPPRLREDGTAEDCQMDVEVRWDRLAACDAIDPSRAAIAYLVERTQPDGVAGGPYELASSRSFEPAEPAEAVPVLLAEMPAQPDKAAPALHGHFVDRGPGYGTIWYRVRARDLFGRTSDPSAPVQVLVRDEVPPGSPVNLTAEYIDPADADRGYSAALSWANRDSAPGTSRPVVVVRWTWPLWRQRQAPDTVEFRLYYRPGLLNASSGAVTAVSSLPDNRFLVQTDLPPVAPDYPLGSGADVGMLRNEGEDYPVLAVANTAQGLQVTVKGPPASPPMAGTCTFALGAGRPARGTTAAKPPHAAWRSYREAAHWGGLLVDPTAAPAPLRIALDGGVLAPLPATVSPDDVVAQRSTEKAEGGDHASYELWLRGIELQTSETRLRASANFGITAVDHAVPANESQVSAPAAILAVHRRPPLVPPLDLDEELYAGPADWHDNSTFELSWTGQRGVGYLVYRASDAQLLAAAGVDMAAHRSLAPVEQRDQLRQLGSRRAFASAFGPVTPEPLWATTNGPMAYTDALDATLRNRFVYRLRTIDLAGNLAEWPPDPPPAQAGQVAVVVAIPPTTPPTPPRWAGSDTTGDDVALHWVPNPEPDLAGYRLYRASEAEAAEDPRSMQALFATPVPEGSGGLAAVLLEPDEHGELAAVPVPEGDTPPERVIRFADPGAEGGRAAYYRLVAEDVHGNRSRPSDVLAVRPPKRAPPQPPVWLALAPGPGGVELSWQAAEDDLVHLLLRRRPEDAMWRPVSAWMTDTAFTDSTVDSGTGYEYRVRVRDRVGHAVDGPVATVTA